MGKIPLRNKGDLKNSPRCLIYIAGSLGPNELSVFTGVVTTCARTFRCAFSVCCLMGIIGTDEVNGLVILLLQARHALRAVAAVTVLLAAWAR